jgi:hypothetical protein
VFVEIIGLMDSLNKPVKSNAVDVVDILNSCLLALNVILADSLIEKAPG